MENFDRENIDELLKICQIRQYFPRQNFVLYGNIVFIGSSYPIWFVMYKSYACIYCTLYKYLASDEWYEHLNW